MRNFKCELVTSKGRDHYENGNRNAVRNCKEYNYKYSAIVVVTNPKAVANEELSKAIDKALSEVREGSRIAIDQIKVVRGMDREEYQDQVVEILLDKGFKVVAKEYLEKLYEEQQNQQLLGMGSAAAQEDYSKAQKTPQTKEVVLTQNTRTKKGYDSPQAAYKAALREAKQTFPNKEVGIRNLAKGDLKVNEGGSVSYYYNYTIVELPSLVAQKLYEAIGKATRRIDDGNRFAIDQVPVTDGKTDKEKVKGQAVDYLLGKGYKVLAKETLQRAARPTERHLQ